jgi:hypothetical protein
MELHTRITRSHWLVGPALGAIIGGIVLGVGGRIAMRGIAIYVGQGAGFSWGGSLTVVALGAVCGAGGGVLLVVMKRLFRSRGVRAGVFWIVTTVVTLRGLRPVDPVRLAAFLPLMVLYGAMLHLAWCRICGGSRRAMR